MLFLVQASHISLKHETWALDGDGAPYKTEISVQTHWTKHM